MKFLVIDAIGQAVREFVSNCIDEGMVLRNFPIGYKIKEIA